MRTVLGVLGLALLARLDRRRRRRDLDRQRRDAHLA